MTYYSIDNQHGDNICGGIQLEHKARECAQRYANDLQEHVLLYSNEPGDEGELVEPATLSHVGREEMLSALAAAVGDDGTGDLGVIIDHASPGDTVEDLIEVVREARAEAAAEL